MKLVKLSLPGGVLNHGYTNCDPGTVIRAIDQESRPQLCTNTVVHAYRSVEQAEIMRHAHGYYGDIEAWEADGDVVVEDGTKVGCREITIGKSIQLAEITAQQRIAVAIVLSSRIDNPYLSAGTYASTKRLEWARRWMTGENRHETVTAEVEEKEAAWAANVAEDTSWVNGSDHDIITDTVRLVLATPESEWGSLLPEVES